MVQRESWQAQIVAKIKRDIAGIDTVISQHAGKPGKPQLAKDQVNYMTKGIDEHFDAIATGRHWSSAIKSEWSNFKKTFNHGEGSWTKSKKLIHELHLRFNDIEP